MELLVEIYTKDGCHLCEEANAVLRKVQRHFRFQIREVDITKNEKTYAQYREQIPVVFINGRRAFQYRVDEREFIKVLKEMQKSSS